ncbi:MAG TPA: YkgJ family cysteine cluster protein [Kofleriaceae bacterium]|nr:YkgJ family cysteine cluster protein [Kofleriaceae bacterium]
MLALPGARFRCTSCGDCCRGWNIPLQEGEAAEFERLARSVLPAERLTRLVSRTRHGKLEIETLAGDGRSCAALQEDQLCAIHAAYGEPAKPKACRIYPFTFVATPTDVRVGVLYSCPAVIDGEGAPLGEQRADLDAMFAGAVDGTRYLTRIGDVVPLGDTIQLPWADAERLIAALADTLRGDGTLVERVGRADAMCGSVEDAMRGGADFDAALEVAQARSAERVAQVLVEPPAVDRLSRVLFRVLIKGTQRVTATRRVGNVFSSFFGGGDVQLRHGGGVAWRKVDAVAPGLGPDGEALLARWFADSLESCTFFGEGAYRLHLTDGVRLLVLSAAAAAFLARAHAAHGSRDSVSHEDTRQGLRQLAYRGDMPDAFRRAIARSTALDLLRAQLG